MTFRSSLLYAFHLIFPRTNKKSTARGSIIGAIICIGISLIPLVVVMSFADGMISGMTQRIIGLSSCELKALKTGASWESWDKSGIPRPDNPSGKVVLFPVLFSALSFGGSLFP